MTVFNGSPKDYAASLGLCKPGRGRMNADALSAVSQARKTGVTFSKEGEPVKIKTPAKPKAAKTITQDEPERKGSIIPKTDYDVKKVRAWAQENGIAVSDRGRVSAEVKAAYGEANPDAEKTDQTKAGKDLRESAPRTCATGSSWEGEFDGKTVIVSEKVCCSNCGVSLGWHTCKNPWAVVGSGVLVPVTLRGV